MVLALHRLRGRTALKYLIDVEKVPYVEAVREVEPHPRAAGFIPLNL